MTPFFIGIAGGSGTGKTALARVLKEYFGEKASILHMDNYQRLGEDIPKINGMKNWDHPKAINWDKLLQDLISLKRGKLIIMKSRDQKKLKIARTIAFPPSKIIIIEGYLLFYKRSIRKLIDFLIYTEASEKIRVRRRTKIKGPGLKYVKKILLPMHYKYIEPMKRYADLNLNTEKYSIKQCLKQIIQHLPSRLNKV